MTRSKADQDYTSDFEEFWKQYPKRWSRDRGEYVKRKKYPAFETWLRLSEANRAKCLRVVRQILKHEGTPRDAVTWLNERGWDDIEENDRPAHHLPAELTQVVKRVENPAVDVNERRNQQMRALQAARARARSEE